MTRPFPLLSALLRGVSCTVVSCTVVSSAVVSCTAIETSGRWIVDPVLVVHGAGGDELGVATDYGVVFLGRTVRSGRVEFTVWFGDGPSREEGVIEPMGNGIYATESEILLPTVMLTFDPPPAGTPVFVRGRRGGEAFEIETILKEDPRVSGVLLEPNEELDALSDQELGAGVFVVEPGQPLRLVGLVSGRLDVEGQRYVTALGPDDLWRLVVSRRNVDRPRRAVYRDDVR